MTLKGECGFCGRRVNTYDVCDNCWKDKRKSITRKETLNVLTGWEGDEPPTEYQKQSNLADKREHRRDHMMMDLVHEFTDKDNADQGAILQKTPKGSDWRKLLVDESKPYVFKVAKQMTDSEIAFSIYEIRTLVTVAKAFSDILYEERETRDRNKELNSA